MKNFNAYKLIIFLVLCTELFYSCYAPSPFYGKWADNNGNTITFNSDMTYMASITVNGTTTTYSGSYSVVENVLVLIREDGSMNTEWDIRGSIMYLTWTDEYGQTIQLSMYHISK